MIAKLFLLSMFIVSSTCLYAEGKISDKDLLCLGATTGKEYFAKRDNFIKSKLPVEEKLEATLAKAMSVIIKLHTEHPELCEELVCNKKEVRQYFMSQDNTELSLNFPFPYGRPNNAFTDYIWKKIVYKRNPKYKSYKELGIKFNPPKYHQDETQGEIDLDNPMEGGLEEPDEGTKQKLEYLKMNPEKIPVSAEAERERNYRAAWARVAVFEYALKISDKGYELYAIILYNRYITPNRKDPNYENSKLLYDYVLLRYVSNVDLVIREMETLTHNLETDEKKVNELLSAIYLLESNELYGAVSLLEDLRSRFMESPDKNKELIAALDKKIVEFKKHNAPELIWQNVFDRIVVTEPSSLLKDSPKK